MSETRRKTPRRQKPRIRFRFVPKKQKKKTRTQKASVKLPQKVPHLTLSTKNAANPKYYWEGKKKEDCGAERGE